MRLRSSTKCSKKLIRAVGSSPSTLRRDGSGRVAIGGRCRRRQGTGAGVVRGGARNASGRRGGGERDRHWGSALVLCRHRVRSLQRLPPRLLFFLPRLPLDFGELLFDHLAKVRRGPAKIA